MDSIRAQKGEIQIILIDILHFNYLTKGSQRPRARFNKGLNASTKLTLIPSRQKKVQVSVYFEKGTFWLSQKAIAALFGVARTVVTKHLKSIFVTKELEADSVCAIFAHTAEDGKNFGNQYATVGFFSRSLSGAIRLLNLNR